MGIGADMESGASLCCRERALRCSFEDDPLGFLIAVSSQNKNAL